MPILLGDIRGLLMALRHKTLRKHIPVKFWLQLEEKFIQADYSPANQLLIVCALYKFNSIPIFQKYMAIWKNDMINKVVPRAFTDGFFALSSMPGAVDESFLPWALDMLMSIERVSNDEVSKLLQGLMYLNVQDENIWRHVLKDFDIAKLPTN
jgi:hypothetical protein